MVALIDLVSPRAREQKKRRKRGTTKKKKKKKEEKKGNQGWTELLLLFGAAKARVLARECNRIWTRRWRRLWRSWHRRAAVLCFWQRENKSLLCRKCCKTRACLPFGSASAPSTTTRRACCVLSTFRNSRLSSKIRIRSLKSVCVRLSTNL